MNTNEEDKKLAQVLKQGAHDPGENPWFTKRVLNKLPEKHSHGSWTSMVLYAIALADKGWQQACKDDPSLAKGLNIVEGKVVYKAVADVFGLPYEALT